MDDKSMRLVEEGYCVYMKKRLVRFDECSLHKPYLFFFERHGAYTKSKHSSGVETWKSLQVPIFIFVDLALLSISDAGEGYVERPGSTCHAASKGYRCRIIVWGREQIGHTLSWHVPIHFLALLAEFDAISCFSQLSAFNGQVGCQVPYSYRLRTVSLLLSNTGP